MVAAEEASSLPVTQEPLSTSSDVSCCSCHVYEKKKKKAHDVSMYHGLQLQIKFQVHLSSPDTYTFFFCNVLMGRSTEASFTYAPGKERITCFTSATREIINYHQFASSVKAALKFKVSGVCFLFPRLHLVI